MVQFNGKYQLEKAENFAEHLIKLGLPEDQAKKIADAKPVLEVTVDGKNVTLSSQVTTKLVVGEEVEESLSAEHKVKSTTTLENDTITVTSKGADGNVGTRIYQFSDAGVVVTIKNSKAGVPDAVRTYKRL